MTESIQIIIDQISTKAKSLHQLLLEERAVNVDLSAKNQELQQQLDRKTAELEDLEAKMIALEVNQVNLAEQNSVPATTPSLGRSQEIDELVKEIEYCIGQLRK